MAAGRGRGVFDGAVKVEQKAQKTDAGQLSRNLLLVPRATVNVKPNLQIVADDVKCTHGCAVSDLEESQLFYFRCDARALLCVPWIDLYNLEEKECERQGRRRASSENEGKDFVNKHFDELMCCLSDVVKAGELGLTEIKFTGRFRWV